MGTRLLCRGNCISAGEPPGSAANDSCNAPVSRQHKRGSEQGCGCWNAGRHHFQNVEEGVESGSGEAEDCKE